MKSAIVEGIIAVANHKLRVEGIKSYKKFLAEEYYSKKNVLELIDKIKLPEDKDYRYSNEYIENWIEELKKEIEGK